MERFHLRFNVSVENAVAMHVLDSLQQLVDVEFDARLGQVSGATLDGLIQVHFHEFEDESEASGRFVARDNQYNPQRQTETLTKGLR